MALRKNATMPGDSLRLSRLESEEHLARIVVDWLKILGWEVWQEVTVGRGRADIVAKNGPLVWIVETKLRMSLAALQQGHDRLTYAHRVSLAIPRASGRKQESVEITRKFLAHLGLGWLSVSGRSDGGRVEELVGPRTLHRPPNLDRLSLCDKQKDFAPAGNALGSYWSPFKETCRLIRDFVERKPGCTIKDVVDAIRHHYASVPSARNSIAHWARAGKIPFVRSEMKGRRILLYPCEEVPEGK